MTPEIWILFGQFVVSLFGAIITVWFGIRHITERIDAKIDAIGREITEVTLAYERKLAQCDAGLRAKMTEQGFFFRDNYVHNDVFDKMIAMASASSENQFRALTESMNRITDRLDIIQSEIHRAQRGTS